MKLISKILAGLLLCMGLAHAQDPIQYVHQAPPGNCTGGVPLLQYDSTHQHLYGCLDQYPNTWAQLDGGGSSGAVWGMITGTLSAQTDLATALAAKVPTTTTVNGHALSSNVVVSASDLTTGTLPHAQLPTLLSGDIPNNAANTSGNAATATVLATPRAINGQNFDGSAAITIAAAAGTLTGTTLASNVVASSLTSVGTLATLTVTATITGSVSGNAATATALAANPTDCASNNYATTIAASGNLTCAQVTDAQLSTSDITTNNVSTSKHGFAPKLDNVLTHFLNGQGGYTAPPGGGLTPSTTDVIATYSGGSYGPIYPLTAPVSTDWSWVNQGSAVLTVGAAGSLNILDPGQGGFQVHMQTHVLPSAPYTITVALMMLNRDVANQTTFAGWYDSSGGKVDSYGIYQGTRFSNLKWSSISAFDSFGSIGSVNQNLGNVIWERFIDDSTNMKVQVSSDGINFTTYTSFTRNTYGTPDHFAFGTVTDGGTWPLGVTLISYLQQ